MKALSAAVGAALLTAVSAASGAAEAPRLVRDLSPGPAEALGSTPWLRVAGGQIFFGSGAHSDGEALWRTDGTAPGTYPVHHFAGSFSSSRPNTMAVTGDRLVSWSRSTSAFGEPWISDGTAEGTYELELCPGSCLPRASAPVEVAAGLVFIGWSPDEGFELRSTDGSPGIADAPLPLIPGPEDGVPAGDGPLRTLGDRALFFGRTDPERHASQLWVTDGTSNGTRLLVDLGAGVAAFEEDALPGRAFFRFRPEGGTDSLWTSDGTAAGTRRLATLVAGPRTPSPTAPLTDRDAVFAVERTAEDPTSAWVELWRSDGTPQGTARIADLRGFFPGHEVFSLKIESLRRFGDRAFFGLDSPHGRVIWLSDGTKAGTRPAASGEAYFEDSLQLASAGDRVVFITDTENRTSVLFSISPDGSGEMLLESDFLGRFADLWAFRDSAVFLNKRSDRYEVWQTDGRREGTRLLFELEGKARSSDARSLLRHGEAIFLVAEGERNRGLVWRTDGSEAGSVAIDLEPEETFRDAPEQLSRHGEHVLASTLDGIYRIDGSGAGSERIFPLAAGFYGFSSRGRDVFFAAEDEAHGLEPWIGDPESGRARLISDLDAGTRAVGGERQPRSSGPWRFTPFAGHVYFTASNGSTGLELWRSDGTAGETVPLETVPGRNSDLFNPISLLPGDETFFLTSAVGVWATGDAQGRLRHAYARRPDFFLTAAAAFRDRLYFVESPDPPFNSGVTAPSTLWRADGTPGGTTELLRGELPWAEPEELTAAGLTLYFTAMTAEHGRELWATDGTVGGTRLVKDIAPGPESSNPQSLRAVAGRVFFSADDGIHGHEPWVSDGTADGTQLLTDVDEGPLASFPREFTPLGGEVMFSAQRSDVGRELFAVARPPLVHRCQPTSRRLCLQDGRIGVEVDWRNPRTGEAGVGRAQALGEESGAFWFFKPGNVEVLVKALDGRGSTESFWFFYGGLSNLRYWVTATDFETGRTRTYHNPSGNLCGRSDLASFGSGEPVPARTVQGSDPAAPGHREENGPEGTDETPGAACEASPGALLLHEGRFAVEVDWQSSRGGGRQGSGTGLRATGESGYFWFFRPENPELAVKVLDGRASNGHFWVLWGALSDLAYRIRVTDLETCRQRVYRNREGNLCGGSDARAFPLGD